MFAKVCIIIIMGVKITTTRRNSAEKPDPPPSRPRETSTNGIYVIGETYHIPRKFIRPLIDRGFLSRDGSVVFGLDYYTVDQTTFDDLKRFTHFENHYGLLGKLALRILYGKKIAANKKS